MPCSRLNNSENNKEKSDECRDARIFPLAISFELHVVLADLEPEVSTTQTEKFDLAASQDGWLNALSLDKLTTTVCQRKECRLTLSIVSILKGHESGLR